MIAYYKLWDYLIRHGYKKTDLLKIGISSSTLAKLSKNEIVTSETQAKICEFLNCQPSDIMEYIPDKTTPDKE